ncbi:MAG: hypothetical protein ACTHQM_07985 [Thermoanaerobaculia bacterium]
MRQKFRILIVCVTAVFLTSLLVRLLYARGGPYFAMPETVLDHVHPERSLSEQTILLCRRAELWMPRGSSLTVIAPQQAPNYDFTLHLTACGQLPRHEVRHPALADDEREHWPDFVLAVGDAKLVHSGYRFVAEFPEGRLYARR